MEGWASGLCHHTANVENLRVPQVQILLLPPSALHQRPLRPTATSPDICSDLHLEPQPANRTLKGRQQPSCFRSSTQSRRFLPDCVQVQALPKAPCLCSSNAEQLPFKQCGVGSSPTEGTIRSAAYTLPLFSALKHGLTNCALGSRGRREAKAHSPPRAGE